MKLLNTQLNCFTLLEIKKKMNIKEVHLLMT